MNVAYDRVLRRKRNGLEILGAGHCSVRVDCERHCQRLQDPSEAYFPEMRVRVSVPSEVSLLPPIVSLDLLNVESRQTQPAAQ